jgi:hypothetical protein
MVAQIPAINQCSLRLARSSASAISSFRPEKERHRETILAKVPSAAMAVRVDHYDFGIAGFDADDVRAKLKEAELEI